MSITLIEVRTAVRSAINEISPRSWEDYELDNWINGGARDIARRAETIQEFHSQVLAFAQRPKYQLPNDIIRLHRVQFIPASQPTMQYRVEKSTYAEMDYYWGSDQSTQSLYPVKYVLWGTPPRLVIQVFPVPSGAGHFDLFYYRHPIKAIRDTDIVEVPEGWHDMINLYAEYQAKRRDKDQTWQEAKQLYEATLGDLITVSRDWTDQSSSFISYDSGYYYEDF